MTMQWLFGDRRLFAPEGSSGGGEGTSPQAAPPPSGGTDGGAVPSVVPAGDGSTLTPSPASATPAVETTLAPAVDPNANPWDALGSTDDLDAMPVPIVPPAVTPSVAPQVATPPAAATTTIPPAAATSSPAQPQTQETPLVSAPSPSDPMSIATAMEANRDAVMTHLVQTKFALTSEDVQELETDVVAAVPKLMARAFFESQVAMQKFLAQSVPGMLQKYNAVTKANDDAETQFFNAHKGLDKSNPQHRQTAVRLATLYRQANPSIPLQQLIAEVGPMVIAAVGAQAPAVASSSAAPVVPRGGTPFRPAVNGSGGAIPVTEPENPWAGLGQNFD